jgi:FkbH-like protein
MKELKYPFDSAQVLQKKKSIRRQLLENPELLTKKVAILGGSTVGETKNILELFLLHHGIRPVFWEGHYNRFYEEAVFGDAELVSFAPDIVYIHTSNKNIEYPAPGETPDAVQARAEAILARFTQVWEAVRERLHCPVIQNNFEEPPWRALGNSDAVSPSGGVHFINELNRMFSNYAQAGSGLYINDLHYQASWYGLERWYDNAQWYMYKYPFALDAIPLVCHNIANIVKSVFGKNKKALVLDLDNTLWGGVIGDDGVENIRLGPETPDGMAFTDFQKYVKALSGTGISLNVCSKNEENTALQGFGHPSSILKRDDFIVFKADWQNKDQNIAEVAGILNVLPESLVYADDNPVERELARVSLPGLAVPELANPEDYVRILDQSGYFEVTALSADDRKRNEYYKANALRQEEQSRFADYDAYLQSLNMLCNLEPFGETNMQRVAQLINKTNQFNLTTRRYTGEEVRQYGRQEGHITLSATLNDKYGDNGIVSVLMACVKGDTAEIDLWVMSCRVFKRNLELAVFDELVRQCRQKGVLKIKGTYIRTNKNSLVEELYGTLGFKTVQRKEDRGVWEYAVPHAYQNMNRVMEVKYND